MNYVSFCKYTLTACDIAEDIIFNRQPESSASKFMRVIAEMLEDRGNWARHVPGNFQVKGKTLVLRGQLHNQRIRILDFDYPLARLVSDVKAEDNRDMFCFGSFYNVEHLHSKTYQIGICDLIKRIGAVVETYEKEQRIPGICVAVPRKFFRFYEMDSASSAVGETRFIHGLPRGLLDYVKEIAS